MFLRRIILSVSVLACLVPGALSRAEDTQVNVTFGRAQVAAADAADDNLEPLVPIPALAAVAGAGQDTPKGEGEPPTGIPQPVEAPQDRPRVFKLPDGWKEIEDSVRVFFSELTMAEDGKITGTVVLHSKEGRAIKGPVRLVLDETGIKGLTLKNAAGKLPERAPYVDLLSKGKSLPAEEATQPKELVFASKADLDEADLQKYAPMYRVLVRDEVDPKARKQARKQKGTNTFTQEELDKTMARQNALDSKLHASGNPDIHGTSTSVDDNGQLYITVYSRIPNPEGVPNQYEGVPVKVELKGPFYPLYANDGRDAEAQNTINTDARFSRPVPIGVGIGNEVDCGYVGTLGARTTRSGGQKYLMSNYHVLVPQRGPSAIRIMQPAGCSNVSSSNSLGNLALYYNITFSTSASNRYDAAWATTSTSLVGTRPPAGYGSLGSTTAPSPGMAVQKFGRTTRFTKGTIRSVNATINVRYVQGTARFIGLVEVIPQAGYSTFSQGGDSGSLIVKQGTNQGTALLFAGGGTSTFGCPLPNLLSGASMTVDAN